MCRTCSIDFFYNYDGFVIELIHKFLIFFFIDFWVLINMYILNLQTLKKYWSTITLCKNSFVPSDMSITGFRVKKVQVSRLCTAV